MSYSVIFDISSIDLDLDAFVVLQANDKMAYSNPDLVKNDGAYYVVSKNILYMSQYFSGLGNNIELKEPMYFEDIDGKTLGLVLMYMEYHTEELKRRGIKKYSKIEKPLTEHIMKTFSFWDNRNYFYKYLVPNNDESNHITLINVLQAADRFKIDCLYDKCIACVASMALDKSTEQMADVFKMPNEFSKEEAKEIIEASAYLHGND